MTGAWHSGGTVLNHSGFLGFSLVPWRPVIEQRLGQQIAATARGGVSWEIGKQRGSSVG
ncbi:DUF3363 domain-containing protein [Brenneria populi]|uniref:DUF3363 domain-containing protein n=1 Tax=Brenneria populi TaxID=1505588 RepID=UPI003D9A1993